MNKCCVKTIKGCEIENISIKDIEKAQNILEKEFSEYITIKSHKAYDDFGENMVKEETLIPKFCPCCGKKISFSNSVKNKDVLKGQMSIDDYEGVCVVEENILSKSEIEAVGRGVSKS